MKILKRIAVSFSIYSRIPMPHFKWSDDDYGHSLGFFPMVGALIGVLSYAVYRLCTYVGMYDNVTAVVLILIPVIITGGFHLDGYMDTVDALKSYRTKEEKLKILDDPHTGAFAIIGLVSMMLISAASATVIVKDRDDRAVLIVCICFVLSRAVSGLLAFTMPHARTDGMLHTETHRSPRSVLAALWSWSVICFVTLGVCDIIYALFISLCYLFLVLYYHHMTVREFGGATGDTAGYFVTVAEVLTLICTAVVSFVRALL